MVLTWSNGRKVRIAALAVPTSQLPTSGTTAADSRWTPRCALRATIGGAWNGCRATCARPPFAAERLEERDAQRPIDHLPKPGPDGRTQLILSPLERIGRSAALVPPPRHQRRRYDGVLAPHSPLRPAVTALAPMPAAPEPVSKPAVETVADDPPPDLGRSPVRYTWAMRLARLYEILPLTGPIRGAERRIIAFIPAAVDVRAILEPIGEPATPPRMASARGPPQGYEDCAMDAIDAEAGLSSDPLAQPEYGYDRRVSG